MKKSQHTPGPWKADTNAATEGITVELSNGRQFYVSSEGQVYDEVAANAHLIAAAPELKTALETIVAYGACEENIELARAAIAKAEGK